MSESGVQVSDAMAELLAGALMQGRPVTVAYVDGEGRPHLSMRGSVQRFSEGELAIWVRDPSGGILKAIETNPHLALMYAKLDFSDPASRAFLTFTGAARIATDEATKQTVYDNSPQIERDRDPERKGEAVIVALDSISGLLAGAFVRMPAAA